MLSLLAAPLVSVNVALIALQPLSVETQLVMHCSICKGTTSIASTKPVTPNRMLTQGKAVTMTTQQESVLLQQQCVTIATHMETEKREESMTRQVLITSRQECNTGLGILLSAHTGGTPVSHPIDMQRSWPRTHFIVKPNECTTIFTQFGEESAD